MQIDDIIIVRTAGLFIQKHGADAPKAAQLKFAELTEAGYTTSAETATKVLAAIERQIAVCGARSGASTGLSST